MRLYVRHKPRFPNVSSHTNEQVTSSKFESAQALRRFGSYIRTPRKIDDSRFNVANLHYWVPRFTPVLALKGITILKVGDISKSLSLRHILSPTY
ncbi:hypothetical protein KAM348_40770 [Aeromonas caviae]|uniref:Uncharacterized protein n=1 Tax=Aeromonas caviae TaxID=648 RepID=A0AAI9PC41_AERCA|nr:hypothetical protein KAM348_40770 [Aeromonas caviae]